MHSKVEIIAASLMVGVLGYWLVYSAIPMWFGEIRHAIFRWRLGRRYAAQVRAYEEEHPEYVYETKTQWPLTQPTDAAREREHERANAAFQRVFEVSEQSMNGSPRLVADRDRRPWDEA